MKTTVLTIICSVLLWGGVLALSTPAGAEFLQTGAQVFQDSADLRAKVVATPSGILFIYAAEPIPLQTFHPLNVPRPGSRSAFVGFDSALNLYSEVVVGAARYAVGGSFALSVGPLTVKVDNSSTPYLTAVSNGESAEPSLIPFTGTSAYGIYSGSAAVSVLEANQTFAHIRDIEPYVVHPDHYLSLKGARVEAAQLGLAIPAPQNPCARSEGAVFLERGSLEKLRALRSSSERRALLQSLLRAKDTRTLSQYIILSIQQDVIVFDPKDSSIRSLTPVAGDGEPQLCEVKKIKL